MNSFDRGPDVLDNVAKSPHACGSLNEVLIVSKGNDIFRRQARVLKWQLIAVFVGMVAIGIAIIGFLFNAIL